MPFAPARGAVVRELGFALPPARMPLWRHGRPLKRWRYVGVYTAELMLCVGDARIGPVPRRWWAVADPSGSMVARSSTGRAGVSLEEGRVLVEAADARIDLTLAGGEAVEVISPADERDGYIWTSKRADLMVTGTVALLGREHRIDGPHGVLDDSAGYHSRHTAWRWSAGVGATAEGRRVAWNLVSGIHDSPTASERTVWVDGEPHEVGPVSFAPDLSHVSFDGGAGLSFSEWAAREERVNLLLVRSCYRQPFGAFTGELPDGLGAARGYGVMEAHDVWW